MDFSHNCRMIGHFLSDAKIIDDSWIRFLSNQEVRSVTFVVNVTVDMLL